MDNEQIVYRAHIYWQYSDEPLYLMGSCDPYEFDE